MLKGAGQCVTYRCLRMPPGACHTEALCVGIRCWRAVKKYQYLTVGIRTCWIFLHNLNETSHILQYVGYKHKYTLIFLPWKRFYVGCWVTLHLTYLFRLNMNDLILSDLTIDAEQASDTCRLVAGWKITLPVQHYYGAKNFYNLSSASLGVLLTLQHHTHSPHHLPASL